MKRNKKLYAALLASLTAAVLAFPALASEKIEDITMEIESGIYIGGYGNGDDVEVSVDNEGCYVNSVTVTNMPSDDEWEEGDKPKLKIVLKAEDGYTFASWINEDYVALDGDEGTVTNVSRSSSQLTIYVTLAELDEYDDDEDDDEDQNLDVEELSWDMTGGLACWDGLDYAKRYDVRLYCDGEAVTEILSTENCYYSFAKYFTKSGSYSFKVRGVRSSSNTGSWSESEAEEVSSEEAARIRQNGASVNTGSSAGSGTNSGVTTGVDPAGKWINQEGIGWWWCNPDRSYPVSRWAQINGEWYYFDPNGYCVMNGWVETSGKWYYCGPTGAMLTSQMIDGKYYVSQSGEWVQ